VTTRGFAYGTVSNLSTVLATTSESGSFGTGTFTYGASGLSCGTTYYFRAYGTNAAGTGYGSITPQATSACSSPTVTTDAASNVSITTATLNGTITDTGGQNATVRGFAYGTVSTLSSVIATTTDSGTWGTGAFTYDASSLTCGTTYYFRAYATNPTGTGYGLPILNFTPNCVDTSAKRIMRLFEGFKILFRSGRLLIHQSQ
jgi:hypothetical protein